MILNLKYTVLFSVLLIVSYSYSQSDTPCSSPPVLPIGAACAYTAGTTVGASYQNNGANGGTASCASPGAPDVWYSFVAPASGTITAALAAGSMTDSGMSLYSGSCPSSFTQISCDDDSGPGFMSQIGASGLTPGATYYLRIWAYSSGTGTFSICITAPAPPAANTTCSVPSPICSGSPISFIANSGGSSAAAINPGNNYTCLSTSPNPSWYYLQIATSGNLIIDITAGSDIDYSIWGPFTNLPNAVSNCNSYGLPQDCSYSSSAIEQAVVNGVAVGQVYVLLVTNYANTVQTININQAVSNTATTNCAIVPLPVGYAVWDASYVNERVELTWVTESEQNCDYFAIQRSMDGLVWETISVVNGHNNDDDGATYGFNDQQPKTGVNYYRLMQVDNNGAFNFTSILSINTQKNNYISVHPNPANNSMFVTIDAEKIENIYMCNILGKIIYPKYNASQNGIEINSEDLNSGAYTLFITDKKGNVSNNRIMISHE